MDSLEIRDRFKEIRAHYQLNQSEFAVRLGLTQAHVSALEIGHNKISISILSSLVRTMNIDLNWLVTGDGSMIRKDSKEISIDNIIIQLEEYKRQVD